MAKTRLTKTLREEILANVLKATNFEKEAEALRAAASKLAREIVSAQLPQAFKEMIVGRPREWFVHHDDLHVGDLRETYSPEYSLSDNPEWYIGRRISIEPIPAPASFAVQINEELLEPFLPLVKQAERLRDQRKELKHQMQAFLASCATVEAVIEKMPELQKHIPVKAQFYAPTVNVNNLFTALTAAGFDNTATS